MASDVGEEKLFCVDRAKQGRAACKKCKQKCATGELRIAKVTASPFGEGKMKNWHHLDCIFEQFLKQRVTTKRIESSEDMDGWDALSDEDKQVILQKIEESEQAVAKKYGLKATPKKLNVSSTKTTTSAKKSPKTQVSSPQPSTSVKKKIQHKDLFFREFRRLVAEISNVSSYLDKTNLVKNLFKNGTEGDGFKGDVAQWCRLLLPGVVKRIYNLQSKQLIKLFSRMFNTDQTEMLDILNTGDIGETIQHFFELSNKLQPAKKSTVTMQQVDDFLDELSRLTKEEDQMSHFEAFVKCCTPNDLKVVIRLIKHDLRMNAGAKHILEAVHPNAYAAYQASRDLNAVVNRFLGESKLSIEDSAKLKASINLMTPVQPMLAEACKSVEQAMKKCPNGMFAEIKYDGERVQLHKEGSVFKYYSRSLKPVLPHKVSHFKDSIPEAFPHAKDLILDSEILMIDTITGKPLPFGSLGAHKKNEFKDANVCLFVFDCIYYNGESLVQKPLEYRKKILQENMTEIPNRVMFSELKVINQPKELSSMIAKVLEMGLEGLVLKDVKSIYEPGKRHWLKVKKDYLHDGAMADTADLIVLGAWYGTGRKAGLKSVFLMGCYDESKNRFCTVTKVHTGHDDKTLSLLQTELNMIEINCNPSKVPPWLHCTKAMTPDFVAKDPKKQPVWEITGAEFTQHDIHTADGISIRFPRVTMIRGDKNWSTATNLEELKQLYRTSKEKTDFATLLGVGDESINDSKKRNVPTEGDDDSEKRHSKKPKLSTPESSTLFQTNGKVVGEVKIINPLPLIFENVQLLVDKSCKDKHEQWLRYFVAYGGTVLKSNNCDSATHVLHLNGNVAKQDVTYSKKVRHIKVDWIKDSVIKKAIQDFRPYTVVLEPL